MLPTLDRDFYRRLAITAAALAVYRLASQIPLPGLSPEALAKLFPAGGPAIERISIVALGIIPVLSVLILAELLKTIAPGLRRWEQAAPQNRDRLYHIVIGIALLMAVAQGAGIANALENVQGGLVPEPGLYFRVACAITLVAGVALVIALAGVIDRMGLGSGIWLIFLTPTLADLPYNLVAIAQASSEGIYTPSAVIRTGLFTAIAVAAVVSIMLAARGSRAVGATCVWPLLIAYMLLSWILIGLGLLLTGQIDRAADFVAAGSAVRLVTLVVLVVLIVWLYVRSSQLDGVSMPVPAAPIAATLAAVALASELLTSRLETVLPFTGVQLVIATVVAMTMLFDWTSIGRTTAPKEDAREPLSPRA